MVNDEGYNGHQHHILVLAIIFGMMCSLSLLCLACFLMVECRKVKTPLLLPSAPKSEEERPLIKDESEEPTQVRNI